MYKQPLNWHVVLKQLVYFVQCENDLLIHLKMFIAPLFQNYHIIWDIRQSYQYSVSSSTFDTLQRYDYLHYIPTSCL